MGKIAYMKKGIVHTAPKKPGVELSTLAEGSIVKFNENGSPVEFYVAKHNYESGLNGMGRTLLVRKGAGDTRVWHTSSINSYATSDIDTWLNGTYKGILDEDVQTVIGTTKFYYTPGNGNSNLTTLSRSIFLLSITELDNTANYVNAEGSVLPIASTLKIVNRDSDGKAVSQWTRSPNKNATSSACYVNSNGDGNYSNCDVARGIRCCFTLPITAVFDEETLLFKGV